MIFNLVGEVLSHFIHKAEALEVFKGVSLPHCSLKLSHLQFADDVLLFLDGGLHSIVGIKHVLQCFQILSGLKINFQKSSLYGFNHEQSSIAAWAEVLGCKIGGSSLIYLGASIRDNPRMKVF